MLVYAFARARSMVEGFAVFFSQKNKKAKGPSSLSGGGQVDGLPPAASPFAASWHRRRRRTYSEKIVSFFEKVDFSDH